MSSISNVFANELALLLFNNTDIANIGDIAGLQNSATAGSYFVSGHTADPGDAGTAATNELTYSGYARVGVVRTSSGWTVSSRNVTNTAGIQFPTSGSIGPESMTHWAICKEVSGSSIILFKGALVDTLVIGLNTAPYIQAGDLDINF